MECKVCSKCLVNKNIADFYIDHRSNIGSSMAVCKVCLGIKGKKWQRSINGLISSMYSKQKARCKRRGHDMPSYSLSEFKAWLLCNPKFDILYDDWVMSNFDTKKIPSIDRLNNELSYSFENIRLVTWKENFDSELALSTIGASRNQRKFCPVIQFDLHGNKIAEYKSIRSAESKTGIQNNLIRRCLSSRRHQTSGYLWMKKESYDSGLRDFDLYQKQNKEVVKLSLDYVLLSEYKSITSAARHAGMSQSHLSAIVSGNKKNHTNFQWMYAKDYYESIDQTRA